MEEGMTMSRTGIPRNKGFTITDYKGLRVGFGNGYAVSIQFGPGNYCGAYTHTNFRKPEEDLKNKGYFYGGATAEVAVFSPADKFLEISGCDVVKGHVDPEEVATLLKFVSELPTGLSHEEASRRVREILL